MCETVVSHFNESTND